MFMEKKIKFMGLELLTTKDTYYPTPETAHLVELAVAESKSLNARIIVDVGTGTGVISLALASKLSGVKFIACDKSNDALIVAKENIKINKQEDNILIQESNYVSGLNCDEPEIIVANLPWGSKYTTLTSNKKRGLNLQPAEAVFHPNGPMESYKELFQSIQSKGWNKSVVLFETGIQSEVSIDRILPNLYRLKRIPYHNQGKEFYSVSIAWQRICEVKI